MTGEADGVDGRTVGNPRLLAVAVTVLLALAAVGTAGAALPAATETAVATDDGPRVTNYVVSSDTLATGEEIVVTATVTNPTRNPVELPVRLRINGSVVETRSVTVGERTRRQVRFVHRVTSGFDRRVTIGDQPPTTVAVEGDLPEVEVTLRQHLAGGAQVVVDSDEPLSALRVRLERIGGETSVTYGDGTFERENGTPVARLLGVPEGDLRVTVTRAVDEDGDDGASGQSDTARITQGTRDTDPPQAIGYSAEADGQTVRVRAPATEPIDEFGIEVRTDGRTRVGWFDGTDVTLRDGAYVGEKQFDYRGDAEVVLQRLTDHAGNDGASGEVERVTLVDRETDASDDSDDATDSPDDATDSPDDAADVPDDGSDTVDTSEPSPGVARFDTNGRSGTQIREVTAAIAAFDDGRPIGGEPVEFVEIAQLIQTYQAGE